MARDSVVKAQVWFQGSGGWWWRGEWMVAGFVGAGVEMPPQHGTLARASRWKRGGVSEDGESQRDLI